MLCLKVATLVLCVSVANSRCCFDEDDDDDDPSLQFLFEEPDETVPISVIPVPVNTTMPVPSGNKTEPASVLEDLLYMIIDCQPLSSEFFKCVIANTSKVFEKEKEGDTPIPDAPPEGFEAGGFKGENLTALLDFLIAKPLVEGLKFFNISSVTTG